MTPKFGRDPVSKALLSSTKQDSCIHKVTLRQWGRSSDVRTRGRVYWQKSRSVNQLQAELARRHIWMFGCLYWGFIRSVTALTTTKHLDRFRCWVSRGIFDAWDSIPACHTAAQRRLAASVHWHACLKCPTADHRRTAEEGAEVLTPLGWKYFTQCRPFAHCRILNKMPVGL